MQSSNNSFIEPKGLKYKPNLALLGSFSCRYFKGEGMFNRISRLTPSSMACSAKLSCSKSSIATDLFLSTKAGKALMVILATFFS